MGLHELERELVENRVLPVLSRLLAGQGPCYLVGGAVRDALLQRLSRDYDFAMAGDPGDLARAFAEALGGHWFLLDGQRRQSRVVAGQGASRLTCDFAPFRATDLDGDLQRRDFTINAMAVEVRPTGHLGGLYDPLDGQTDLHHGQLRNCSPPVLLDDPLRVLKGLRHCLDLQLAIEPNTLNAMRQAAPQLDRVAVERIRQELCAMLAATPARRALLWLQEFGVLGLLFGDTVTLATGRVELAPLDRAEAWLAALFQAEDDAGWATYLARELEQGVSHAVALKLAAWLAGQGISDGRSHLQKLRFSTAVQRAVCGLLALRHEHLDAMRRLPNSARSRALWVEDLGSHPPLALCFLALQLDMPFPEALQLIGPLFKDLQRYHTSGRIPNLVSGRWLQQELGVQGPLVRRYLDALRQEEIAGRVLTSQQAKEFLLRLARSKGQKND